MGGPHGPAERMTVSYSLIAVPSRQRLTPSPAFRLQRGPFRPHRRTLDPAVEAV